MNGYSLEPSTLVINNARSRGSNERQSGRGQKNPDLSRYREEKRDEMEKADESEGEGDVRLR